MHRGSKDCTYRLQVANFQRGVYASKHECIRCQTKHPLYSHTCDPDAHNNPKNTTVTTPTKPATPVVVQKQRSGSVASIATSTSEVMCPRCQQLQRKECLECRACRGQHRSHTCGLDLAVHTCAKALTTCVDSYFK